MANLVIWRESEAAGLKVRSLRFQTCSHRMARQGDRIAAATNSAQNQALLGDLLVSQLVSGIL